MGFEGMMGIGLLSMDLMGMIMIESRAASGWTSQGFTGCPWLRSFEFLSAKDGPAYHTGSLH